MKPRIEKLAGKRIIGIRMVMSISSNNTFELWRTFMPRRNEIKNSVGTDLYSMRVYGLSYFRNFKPDLEFEKWAGIEVYDFDVVPIGMESFILTAGLYAVFQYKGAASDGTKAFQYIYAEWLPNSDYILDDRPHFEVLGEKYKNEDPGSEEEIWIPIRPKS
jgi:AraC family transcriptional regulator